MTRKRIFLSALWQECNRLFFSSKLKRMPSFTLMRSQTKAAVFTSGNKRDRITINEGYFKERPYFELVDTLLHEMIHQYQHENDLPLEHDKFFFKECERIGLPDAQWAALVR